MLITQVEQCKKIGNYDTCNLTVRYTNGMATNKTCQVTTANTPRLLNTLIVALKLKIKVNGTSRSTILKSEETYMHIIN